MDIVWGPVKEMMREIGVPYAHSFLEHTIRTHQLSEEDIMQMYSAIYAISGNTKAEKEFYRNFICAWLEQDKDRYLSAILPADSYEDKGVYTFSPYQVLPVQVQNTGANGRGRRMNPTKTAYMVYYQDISGSGYQWSEQALTHELGQKIVDAGTTVERRVFMSCCMWRRGA